MKKRVEKCFIIILTIILLFNSVLSSCSYSTQTEYKTKIIEVKTNIEAYTSTTADVNDGVFKAYLNQLYNIILTTTGENGQIVGYEISDDELKDILGTISLVEGIKSNRDDEIFPGTDESSLMNEILSRKEAIAGKIGNQPPIDEFHPNYNLYYESFQTNKTDELDGASRIISWVLKLVTILPGLLGQAIMSLFKAGYGTENSQAWLTIDNILFNQLTLTDINIFSENVYLISGENASIVENELTDNALLPMRQSIANWYYAFRNFAIVLSLLMLIYIGIRIALTNIAEKKAEYKNMLVNWFTGFSLIFILHYIIIIVININNAVIQILARTNLNPDNSEYQNYMNNLLAQVWWVDLTVSWTSAILYDLLVIITFIMLIMFIKRLITVSILVVVAPLIGITYSVDKSGDNKSQVVDTWLKEFMFNVFIQIAYAASYLIFGRIAMDLAFSNSAGDAALNFGTIFLAVLSMISMFMGVKVIKQIFGFDKASNLVQQLAVATVFKKTVSTATKGVKGAKGVVDKRVKLKQEKQQKDELKNVPKYTPEGKSTAEVVKAMKKQKEAEELKSRMTEKEGKRKHSRRAYRNKSKIISIPANMIERGTRNIIGAIGDYAGKINGAISGKQQVVIPAKDIFNSLLHSYVKVSNKRTGTRMTKEQFEANTKKIANTPLKDLTEEEKSLRKIIGDMNKKFGKNEAQSIVAHFKDEKWGNNGTSI